MSGVFEYPPSFLVFQVRCIAQSRQNLLETKMNGRDDDEFWGTEKDRHVVTEILSLTSLLVFQPHYGFL